VFLAAWACVLMVDTVSNKQRAVQFVTIHELSKSYATPSGVFLAIDRISLGFGAGEFVAIVGKSGSGKSTLLNLIAGIDRPSSGEIRVAGAAVHQLDESALSSWRGRNVGIVFQFFQLLPTLTILENVLLPMDFCGTYSGNAARQRALSLLDQVGIADQADKLSAALSGGQQQRAAIARALANDPPLIVADEPTGNLDSHTAGSVLDLLRGLTERGKTVIMVTHERDMISIVDRVVTLVDGRVSSPNATSHDVPSEVSHA